MPDKVHCHPNDICMSRAKVIKVGSWLKKVAMRYAKNPLAGPFDG